MGNKSVTRFDLEYFNIPSHRIFKDVDEKILSLLHECSATSYSKPASNEF
jgi:hypothetical protein